MEGYLMMYLSGCATIGAVWDWWSIRQQDKWHRRYMRAWKRARRQWRREAPLPLEL